MNIYQESGIVDFIFFSKKGEANLKFYEINFFLKSSNPYFE